MTIKSIQELSDVLEAQLKKLSLIHQDIGYSPEAIETKKSELLDAIYHHVEHHLQETEFERQSIMDETDQCQKDILSFKKLMGEFASNNLVLNPTKSLQANLQDVLNEKLKVEERYNERLSLVKELYLQLEEFKEAMGDFVNTEMLKSIDVDVSSLAVNALQEEIQRCEEEYTRRKEKVESQVERITYLFVSLGIPVESDRDRIIESYYHEKDPTERMKLCHLLVSQEFMAYLELRQSQLEEEKLKVESHKEGLINDLKQLWHRLRCDLQECEVFLMANRGLTIKEIQKFENELKRLSILKKERIGEFITTTREELKSLWDQLYFTKEQREAFKPAYATELTDECLEAHEAEISRLQLELEDSSEILERIEKHKKLKKEMEDFEAITKDPTRLFGKGQRDPGRLLREEKFRKRISRELPKVVKELEGYLLEYEALKGYPFLVYGKPYFDVLYENQQKTIPNPTQERKKNDVTRVPKPIVRKPMTSPRINRTKKLFFNTPQVNRSKSFHQFQSVENKIDTTESILHRVRDKNIRKQKQIKKSNLFDEDEDDEETVTNENINPIKTMKHKRKRTQSNTVTHYESDDNIGLDLGIFDDGPDLSDMSEIDA